VGLKSLKSLNLTNVYPNNKKNKNNKVKSKPLELRSRVKSNVLNCESSSFKTTKKTKIMSLRTTYNVDCFLKKVIFVNDLILYLKFFYCFKMK
jgi:hypothetical protein